jgi:hypothetical protein
MSKRLLPRSDIAKLIREITQEGYEAGYKAGWRERAAAEHRAQTNRNGRPRPAARDLKFAITQLHPDRFHGDESSAKRANRVTAWLLDELKAACSPSFDTGTGPEDLGRGGDRGRASG